MLIPEKRVRSKEWCSKEVHVKPSSSKRARRPRWRRVGGRRVWWTSRGASSACVQRRRWARSCRRRRAPPAPRTAGARCLVERDCSLLPPSTDSVGNASAGPTACTRRCAPTHTYRHTETYDEAEDEDELIISRIKNFWWRPLPF